jgi:hypothetical protein
MICSLLIDGLKCRSVKSDLHLLQHATGSSDFNQF